MALTAAGMASKVKAAMAFIPEYQGSDNAVALAYRDQVVDAMCQGIIDEITANAVVTTTSGAPDGEHTGSIS